MRPCWHTSTTKMAISDPPPLPLITSTSIPIAQLSPSLDALSHQHLEGVVTLLWPYSSSARTFTLLIAEPDFRLRRSRGQARVSFHGECAKIVANTRVGIGDVVKLGLQGVQWEKPSQDEHPVTPGKGIEWNLRYEDRATLEVRGRRRQLLVAQICTWGCGC